MLIDQDRELLMRMLPGENPEIPERLLVLYERVQRMTHRTVNGPLSVETLAKLCVDTDSDGYEALESATSSLEPETEFTESGPWYDTEVAAYMPVMIQTNEGPKPGVFLKKVGKRLHVTIDGDPAKYHAVPITSVTLAEPVGAEA